MRFISEKLPVFVSCFILVCFTLSVSAKKKPAFKLYNKKGQKASYSKLLKATSKSDIVLFGEYHDNPISHWLQLELSKDLHNLKPLILGAEMIEADNQHVLNLYLKAEISYKGLDSLARLWPNYKTDYAPLVDFAKESDLHFIASNIPRRYARKVHRKGGFSALDSLVQNEKDWIAPLPIRFNPDLPQYKKMLDMMHRSPNKVDIVKAQAIKDATMAYFILKNYKDGHVFLHFNGAYHSDFYEGILWYLKQENPNLNYMTISTVSQKDLKRLEPEHKGRADFIICVDEDMTRTF